jgi:hypothetical protein
METPYMLPSSIYWIGDVRHVMPDDIFYNVWKHNNYEEGVYNVDNYKFIAVPTICGDDYYEDSEGFIYQVISGHLGLIDMALCTNATMTQLSKGKIFTFENPIYINMVNGIIKIYSHNFKLNIDTNEDEDENDEYLDEEYKETDNVVKDPDYVPEDYSEDYSEDFTEDFSDDFIDDFTNDKKKYEI